VDILVCVATALAAYLLGSIPTGYLVGRAKGMDIRKVGSGNIGATNVFRILGRTAGAIVLVVDCLKGWVAVAVAPGLVTAVLGGRVWNGSELESLRIVAAMSVILGHNYPCWLKFKGGKGIATSAGVLAALIWWGFVAVLVTWVVVCLLTRYVSVASIASAVVLPFATWAAGYSHLLVIIAAAMCVLAVYKHHGNIKRLMDGTENRIGAGKNAPPAEAER
jgi:glycerol-3-phosphate acyltransferase PlsY